MIQNTSSTRPDIELRCSRCDQWFGMSRTAYEARRGNDLWCDFCRGGSSRRHTVRLFESNRLAQDEDDPDSVDWRGALREMQRRRCAT